MLYFQVHLRNKKCATAFHVTEKKLTGKVGWIYNKVLCKSSKIQTEIERFRMGDTISRRYIIQYSFDMLDHEHTDWLDGYILSIML